LEYDLIDSAGARLSVFGARAGVCIDTAMAEKVDGSRIVIAPA
jgi:hypothetical protein